MPSVRKRAKVREPQTSLPSCEGPRLNRFGNGDLPIEFLRLLSDPDTAAHSHVFEVKIGEEKYALKVFRFYDLEDDEPGLSDSELKDPDLLFHIDPFFAECRAFGRIAEAGKNGILAVRCFGFVHIAANREVELESRFEAGEWDRPETEYDQAPSSRQPLRAIVKSLVTEETVWNARTSKKVLRKLKSLHALGIYLLDIREENIVGGEFVDFSASWTEPHTLLRSRAQDEGLSPRERDLLRFDGMMKELQIRRAPRARRDMQYCMKLRSANSPRKAVR